MGVLCCRGVDALLAADPGVRTEVPADLKVVASAWMSTLQKKEYTMEQPHRMLLLRIYKESDVLV